MGSVHESIGVFWVIDIHDPPTRTTPPCPSFSPGLRTFWLGSCGMVAFKGTPRTVRALSELSCLQQSSARASCGVRFNFSTLYIHEYIYIYICAGSVSKGFSLPTLARARKWKTCVFSRTSVLRPAGHAFISSRLPSFQQTQRWTLRLAERAVESARRSHRNLAPAYTRSALALNFWVRITSDPSHLEGQPKQYICVYIYIQWNLIHNSGFFMKPPQTWMVFHLTKSLEGRGRTRSPPPGRSPIQIACDPNTHRLVEYTP